MAYMQYTIPESVKSQTQLVFLKISLFGYSYFNCHIYINVKFGPSQEENRATVFEKRVLKRLYGPHKEELIGVWKARYDFGRVVKQLLRAAVSFVI
jgi:hypothetical protein